MTSYDHRLEDDREMGSPALCEACQHREATLHTFCLPCFRDFEAMEVQRKADDVAAWAKRHGQHAAAELLERLAKQIEEAGSKVPRLFDEPVGQHTLSTEDLRRLGF